MNANGPTKLEQALQESEERFRLIADTAPVMIWMSGTDKLCTYFNKPWLEFRGRSMEEELGNGWAEGVHREDLQRCLQTYTECFDRREKFRMEYRLRRYDGEYRWILDIGVPRFHSDGSFAGYAGACVDVHEQKLAEENLGRANERLSLALEAGRAGGWDWEIKTGRNFFFGKTCELLGIRAEEYSGSIQEFWERVHPEDREWLRNAEQEAMRNHSEFLVEFRVVWPDGTVHWLRSQAQFFYGADGQAGRMMGLATDITERKEAEEKLREYEKAVEGLEEMFVVIDRDRRYRLANRKFLDMRKMSKEQVVGHLAHEVVHREAYDAIVKEKMAECFEGKVVRYEIKYRYPEIGERYIAISYFPVEGPKGIDRIACIFQDITERRLAEEALARAAARTAEYEAAMRAALATVNRKLIEAQEQERTRIARELHDDICQRLCLLALNLDQVQRDNPNLSSEVRNRIRELQDETGEISTDVQAISHTLHAPRLEHLGVAAAMGAVCREFSARHRMEVSFQSQDLPVPLPAEISLCLIRVLQEALQNAAKHSGARNATVELSGAADEIHLVVSDSGKGFNVEETVQGRGLGLTSMQERVRVVNGSITIQSTPMGGTIIDVRVPVSRGQQANSARAGGMNL
jgi:PAS domain S-box-containing protein